MSIAENRSISTITKREDVTTVIIATNLTQDYFLVSWLTDLGNGNFAKSELCCGVRTLKATRDLIDDILRGES